MNFVVMGAALFVGALLEDVTPAWAIMGWAEAPIVLGIVLYYALNRSVALMLSSALIGGIISDALGCFPPGASVACLFLVGAVARGFRDVIFTGRWATHVVLGAAGGAGYTLMMFAILASADPFIREVSFSWIAAKVLGVSLLAAPATALLFFLMRWLDTMMGNIGVVEPE